MSAPQRPLRACIAGAGLMGRWHADAVSRAGGVVVAVADRDSAAARRLARRYGAIDFSELQAALARVPAAVVHVCTPLSTHAELVRLALDGGAHVVVEKPMAATAGETRELLALAETRARMIVPVHQFVFQRGVLDARTALGDILQFSSSICSAGAGRPGASSADRIVDEILPHPVSVALAFGLAPADGSLSVLSPREGELTATWRSGGATVLVSVSMSGRPPHNHARLVGSRATAHLDFFHGYAFVERTWTSRWRKALAPFELAGRRTSAAAANLLIRAARREWAYPGLRELVAGTYAAIAAGDPAPIPAETVLRTATIRDGIMSLADDARKRR